MEISWFTHSQHCSMGLQSPQVEQAVGHALHMFHKKTASVWHIVSTKKRQCQSNQNPWQHVLLQGHHFHEASVERTYSCHEGKSWGIAGKGDGSWGLITRPRPHPIFSWQWQCMAIHGTWLVRVFWGPSFHGHFFQDRIFALAHETLIDPRPNNPADDNEKMHQKKSPFTSPDFI